MFQCVNPQLTPHQRTWWTNNFLHGNHCGRCCPLATRRFRGSILAGKLLPHHKRLLKDTGESLVFTVIVIEHGHGRLRWMSRHSGPSGGAFVSTMSGHQQFFMQSRWHSEALDAHTALKLEQLEQTDAGLLDQLQEGEKKLYTPAFACFCKRNGLSYEDSRVAWDIGTDQGAWRQVASAERAQARLDVARLKREIAETGVDEASVPLRTPLGLGDSEMPLSAKNLAQDPSLEPVQPSYRFGSAIGLDSGVLTKSLYAWAVELDKDAPEDKVLGRGAPVYDTCCEHIGQCLGKLTTPKKHWLESLECLLNIFRSFVRSTLQNASRLFVFAAQDATGKSFAWFHLLACDADDDPKFTFGGFRCPIRPSYLGDMPADGSPPDPPYEVQCGFRTFIYAPPTASTVRSSCWIFCPLSTSYHSSMSAAV